MANHRAGKQQASRVDSAKPGNSPRQPAAPGKRKAVKPSRAERRQQAARAEVARAEAARAKQARLEAEEAARAEAARQDAARAEAARAEAARAEAVRDQAARLEAARAEAARDEETRAKQARLRAEEAVRAEAARLEAAEADRAEAEQLEAARTGAARAEAAGTEAASAETARTENAGAEAAGTASPKPVRAARTDARRRSGSGRPAPARRPAPSRRPAPARRRTTSATGAAPTSATHLKSHDVVPEPSHIGGKKSRLGVPSAPRLVSAAAIVAATAGAVTVGQYAFPSQMASDNIQRLSAQASALSGDSAVSSSDELASRQRAVSRDSERQALQDAANKNLQAAAEAQAKQRAAALAQLRDSAEKRAQQIAALAWQLPIAPGIYHLTAGFGETSALWASVHTGLDFAAPTGTPIHSVAKGVVTDVGYAGAYGNRTIVTLGDGTEIWYCHQNGFSASEGQSVMPGDTIGYVGSTGNVTGPHLHLEVRPGAGDPVDPYTALVYHGLHP